MAASTVINSSSSQANVNSAKRRQKSKHATERANEIKLHSQVQNLVNNKPILDWTVDDVCLWLSFTNNQHFSHLVSTFKQNNINGKKLVALSNDKHLKQYVETASQAKSLAFAIGSLKQKSSRNISQSNRDCSKSLGFNSNSNSNSNSVDETKNGESGRNRSSTTDVFRALAQKLHLKHSYDGEGNIVVVATNSDGKNVNEKNSNMKTKSKKDIWNIYKNAIIGINNNDNSSSNKKNQSKNGKNDKNDRIGKYKIINQGWLWKRGKYHKTFKRRWFILLKDNFLLYFDQRPIKENDKPTGVIYLNTIDQVVPNMIDINDENINELEENEIDAKKNNGNGIPIKTDHQKDCKNDLDINSDDDTKKQEKNDNVEMVSDDNEEKQINSDSIDNNKRDSIKQNIDKNGKKEELELKENINNNTSKSTGNLSSIIKEDKNEKDKEKEKEKENRIRSRSMRSMSSEDLNSKYCNQFILKSKERDWIVAAPDTAQYMKWISDIRFVKKFNQI